MKNYTFFSVFTVLLIFSTNLNAQFQVEWDNIFALNSTSFEQSIGNGIDSAGSYYVGGAAATTTNPSVNYDFLIIKYNPSGDTVWTRTFDIDADNSVTPVQFYADKGGNTYICGMSFDQATQEAVVVTLMYNADGDLIYQKVFDPVIFAPALRSMIVDENGNVFITIFEQGITVIKYNPDGSEGWTKNLPLFVDCRASAVDNMGNIVITGSMNNQTNFSQDFVIIKYDTNGDTLFTRMYDAAGFDDYPANIIIDNQNNIIVGGTAQRAQNFETEDAAVVKFSSSGDFLWAKTYNGPADFRDNIAELAVDESDNVYAAGNNIDNNFFYSGFIIKYSPAGDSLASYIFSGDTTLPSASKRNGISGDFRMTKFALFITAGQLFCTGVISSTQMYLMWLTLDNLTRISYVRYLITGYDFINNYAAVKPMSRLLNNADDNFEIYMSGTGIVGSGMLNFDIITAKYIPGAVDVKDEKFQPEEFVLHQNYPNPFNPVTTIRYTIPVNSQSSIVNLKVYDVLGDELAVLVNETKQPGDYEVTFNASKFSSGVYFYKLTAGSVTAVKKMTVLK